MFENVQNIITTFAAGTGTLGSTGDGGAATSAQLCYPSGISVDSYGNVFIADINNNKIRMVNSAGIITTIAGVGIIGSSGDGGAATSAQLNEPHGVSVDSFGNVFVADTYNHKIRMVNSAGIITTLAGTRLAGSSGDGGAATSAQLNSPFEVSADISGNVYIGDEGNNKIRMVNSAGIITTFAGTGTQGSSGDGGKATSAQLYLPTGVSADIYGNLYIADYHNNKIRTVNSAGIITTFAGTGTLGSTGDGGAATSAQLYQPYGVSADISGNVYIADTINNKIRMVNSAGIITTIAGVGIIGNSGDGGAATSAQLNLPFEVSADRHGNVFIADTYNHKIRLVVRPQQPTRQPSSQPSTQPSMRPSKQPTSRPSNQPSRQPTSQPSCQPSKQPNSHPSTQPSRRPSARPSSQPSQQPTRQPSRQPSARPSSQPSQQPTRQPTSRPSNQPTRQPTSRPSRQPTVQPSEQPSMRPTVQPSSQPSCQPSKQPNSHPSAQPSRQPSIQPSTLPSSLPSEQPSIQPSVIPSRQPTSQPSVCPSKQPISRPSNQPSEQPSTRPSRQPTTIPSAQPSGTKKCAAGMYSMSMDTPQTPMCAVCPAGTFSAVGAFLCTVCADGKYRFRFRLQYICSVNSSICVFILFHIPCVFIPNAPYHHILSVYSGAVSRPGSSKCSFCPAGYFTITGLDCAQCAAGSSSLPGSSVCSPW